MNEYLLEPHAKVVKAAVGGTEEKEKVHESLEHINKLEREISILQNLQVNQSKFMVQTLDQSIERYTKNLASQKRLQQELEGRMLSYAEELANRKEETRQVETSGKNKMEKLSCLIKDAEDDVQAMLIEKERHQKALEAVAEEVKNKFKALKKLEVEKFHDAESIYKYKKLSLMKQIQALDADIEAVIKETELTKKRFDALKMTHRELRTKYYKLQKP